MERKIIIRNEEKRDWTIVEDITRKAFYNLYVQGCVEHYLVHIMRNHEDFIPELDFVLELDGNVIGNIMYTKAKLFSRKCPKQRKSKLFKRKKETSPSKIGAKRFQNY